MKSLFLDDIRKEPEGWFVVRNYNQFIEWIKVNGLPDVVSFDHDLADEHYNDYLSDENFGKKDDEIKLNYDKYQEKTGYDCAKWLVQYCLENKLDLPIYYIHTCNGVGRINIQKTLENFNLMKEIYEK